jgi:hypothetical protein
MKFGVRRKQQDLSVSNGPDSVAMYISVAIYSDTVRSSDLLRTVRTYGH